MRNKAELKIPKTFEEYNKIAEFFATSDRLEEHYFSNLTLGNLGVTATEFLTRLFSHKNHLYGKDGMVISVSSEFQESSSVRWHLTV